MPSGSSMDNPVTQASLSAERFDLRHPCHNQGRELAEIIGIVSWLGIILVKGFSFVVPIIAANSLPWV